MSAIKTESGGRYKLNNVLEAFSIISKMLDANDCPSLTQLSKDTHISKNKTFRLLSTLEQCGIVEKTQQNNYKIGMATIGIARKIMAKTSLLDSVRPYMEELVRTVDEAVYFASCISGEAVLVDYVDCNQPIKVTSFIGKVVRHCDRSNPKDSFNRVARIGDIVIEAGGIDPDVTTVSMPFIDGKGIKMGEMIVLAPTFRIPLDHVKSVILPAMREILQRSSLQISKISDDVFLPSFKPVERVCGSPAALFSMAPRKAKKNMPGLHG